MPPTVNPTNKVPRPVVLSLYRSLLKEVKVLDSMPILKVLMPIPPKFQSSLRMSTPLYVPGNTQTYAALVKEAFRTAKRPDPSLGFEALGRIRMHVETVGRLLPKITKDHLGLTKALSAKEDVGSQYHAKFATLETPQAKLLPPPATAVPKRKGRGKKTTIDSPVAASSPVAGRAPAKLKVGMGLIAHPLSSSHVDRRVMMVVDANPDMTTAIVLDMLYSYPLSHGNPMFPEVFWGHEVYGGGYCHVDFTMPPTANVAVLHTLEPPVEGTPEHTSWLTWMKSSGEKGTPVEHHELLCKLVKKGETLPNGTVIPNLYFSKAEALPYLATLCPGKLRSSLRIYWGVMKWPTAQIEKEVEKGHWMPVEMSANFFGAYPFVASAQKEGERFPTMEELKNTKEARIRVLGANVTVPQTFPPSQPLCGRESLWDQILYSMGGEFRQLVGTINPFSNPRSDYTKPASPQFLTESGGSKPTP